MKSIFLDSNIWLRLFLKDQENQYTQVSNLFKLIEESHLRPYTSTIVFLEVNFVLTSFYSLTKEKALFYLNKIREVRNITIIENENLDNALKYYRHYKIKFTDCLIAAQIPKGLTLVSFDKDFKKIKEVASLTPAELLS